MSKKPKPLEEPNPVDDAGHDSIVTLFTRVYRFAFGPIFSILLLVAVAQDNSAWMTTTDVVYFVLLILIPISSWLESRIGNVHTADGTPVISLRSHAYEWIVVCGGLCAWIVANVIGHYVLVS